MTATRVERVVGIRTAIKGLLVQGLEDVFSNSYPNDNEFQNLHIVPSYPNERNQYPCIVLRYQGRRDLAAGVGHYEVFPDPTGSLRKWGHRRFEGRAVFTVAALTPLSRDVLADALHEVLAFGRFTTALSGLLVRVYGNAADTYNPMGLLFQLNMNTDEIEDGDEGANPAPWQAEDGTIYTVEFSIEVTGGYYNSIPTDDLKYIEAALIGPYLLGDTLPFSLEGDTSRWEYTFAYYDDASVIGHGVCSAPGRSFTDRQTAIGNAVISSTDIKLP